MSTIQITQKKHPKPPQTARACLNSCQRLRSHFHRRIRQLAGIQRPDLLGHGRITTTSFENCENCESTQSGESRNKPWAGILDPWPGQHFKTPCSQLKWLSTKHEGSEKKWMVCDFPVKKTSPKAHMQRVMVEESSTLNRQADKLTSSSQTLGKPWLMCFLPSTHFLPLCICFGQSLSIKLRNHMKNSFCGQTKDFGAQELRLLLWMCEVALLPKSTWSSRAI